jgi:hypothetical protein
LATQGPPHGATALDPAASEDDVRVLGGLQEARQRRRIVAEVRIHLEDVRVVAFERPLEAGEVGFAESLLAGPVQDVHAGIARGSGIGELPRAIGRIVVHDQHLDLRNDVEDAVQQRRQIFPLVIGRNDDQRLEAGGSGHAVSSGGREDGQAGRGSIAKPAAASQRRCVVTA